MIHQLKKNKYFPIIIFYAVFGVAGMAGCNRETSALVTKSSSAETPAPNTVVKTLDRIELPARSSGASGHRPIIAIHGLGDTPENFSLLFKEISLPTKVILPRAPVPHGRGGSWFPVSIPVRDTHREVLKKDVSKATRQLCQFIQQSQFRLKPVVTGFSQGGILSYAMAIVCPTQIHASVPVSGFLPLDIPSDNIEAIPRIIAFHGSADAIIAHAWDNASIDKLQQAGIHAELHSYKGVGHTITGLMHRQWFTVLKNFL